MSVVKLPVGDRFAYSSLQFTVNLLDFKYSEVYFLSSCCSLRSSGGVNDFIRGRN